MPTLRSQRLPAPIALVKRGVFAKCPVVASLAQTREHSYLLCALAHKDAVNCCDKTLFRAVSSAALNDAIYVLQKVAFNSIFRAIKRQ